MTVELTSLADLGAHLMHDTNEVLLRTHDALAASADLLHSEAVSEFGDYQAGIGPFPSWAELSPVTKEERVRLGFTENDPLLRAGDLRDSIEQEVHLFDAFVGSTSDIMPYHEFGTATIPPRPVLGIALQRCWPEIQKMMGLAVSSGFSGGAPMTSLTEAGSSLEFASPVPQTGYKL